MSILRVWNSRSILSCHLRSSLHYVTCNSCNPIQSSLKPHSPLNKKLFSTSSSHHSSGSDFYSYLSSSAPILTLENVLLDFHSLSGLPWWCTIMLSTLGIRTVFIFPLAALQNQVIARLANLNAELGKMAPQLTEEVNIAAKMHGWTESQAKKIYRKTMKDYYKKFILRDNCHPFKTVLLALFQIPIWICFSISLRNISIYPWLTQCDTEELQNQLQSEGMLWLRDLTTPDATFIIPILLGIVNLALIEIHVLRKIGESSNFQKILLYIMRFSSIFVAGVATLNPSSVSFYWLCSSTFGLVQSILLMSPRFRLLLRIPRTANESSTPFKDIATNFKKRFLP